RRTVRTGLTELEPRAIAANRSLRTIAGSKRGRRGIVQEAHNVVEDVASCEEAAEDLGVHTMHPAAAEFDVVAALDYRKLVAQIGAPEKLVDSRFQEEGLAKPEGRRKIHR